MPLLTCQNVSFDYDNRTVVEKLNFSVEQGDYLCVVGENGAGKSTLIKGLLGLKRPSAGTVSFGGGLLKNEIGYLPQQSGIQRDFPSSVWEVVLSGNLAARGLRPFYSNEDKKRATENLLRLGVLGLRRACYRELSGGQQQRVLLARALCATRKLILLDEPVAGLDPLVTADLYRLINGINESGLTVIMVSHDIHSAVKYSNRILHLKNRQLYFGDTTAYAASPLGRAFMGEETATQNAQGT